MIQFSSSIRLVSTLLKSVIFTFSLGRMIGFIVSRYPGMEQKNYLNASVVNLNYSPDVRFKNDIGAYVRLHHVLRVKHTRTRKAVMLTFLNAITKCAETILQTSKIKSILTSTQQILFDVDVR